MTNMYKVEAIINNINPHFFNAMKDNDYYIVDGGENFIVLEHSENKSKIRIYETKSGDLYANFRNKFDVGYLDKDLLLGDIEVLTLKPIFDVVIWDDKFEDFCNSNDITKNIRIHKGSTLLDKFKTNEYIDRFLRLNHSIKVTLDELDKFIFEDNNFGLTLKVYNEENKSYLQVYNNKGQSLIKEYLGDNSVIANVVNTFIIFYDTAYREIQREEIAKKYAEPQQSNINVNVRDTNLTDTQNKIKNLCDKISEILIYKNKKYGNSAIEPNGIFYKGNARDSILIRLDDKIGRIKNNNGELRTNDIVDIIGYLVLLLIVLNVGYSELEKLKD